MKKINVAIVGVTGYTGEELLKILARHQGVTIAAVCGRSANEHKPLGELYPQFAALKLTVEAFDSAAIAKKADLVFLALPHAVAFGVVPELLNAGLKVIDLSADFRLASAALYEQWYGLKHTADAALAAAVYGLPELNRDAVRGAALIANPGCYPTSVLLGCAPLIKNNLIDTGSIIIDAKSGVSGSGRKTAAEYFSNEHPNFRPYKIAGTHRHVPEIEQELSKLAGKPVIITFTPQIIPLERGMVSVIYMDALETQTTAGLHDVFAGFYRREPFVRVLEGDDIPDIRKVSGTNYCDISVRVDKRSGKVIVVSAIDNLVKGASGLAVQNMNIMCGFDEKEGLV